MLSSTGPSIFPRLRWLPCSQWLAFTALFHQGRGWAKFPTRWLFGSAPNGHWWDEDFAVKTQPGWNECSRGRPSSRLYLPTLSWTIRREYTTCIYSLDTDNVHLCLWFHFMFYTFWCYIHLYTEIGMDSSAYRIWFNPRCHPANGGEASRKSPKRGWSSMSESLQWKLRAKGWQQLDVSKSGWLVRTVKTCENNIHPASRGVAAHTAGLFRSVRGAKGGFPPWGSPS